MAGVATPATPPKRSRTRSPAYPYINLESALLRAKQFYDQEQRNAANINIAAKHWGYVEAGSNGSQTAAALIYFGLLQDEGTGDKRTVRLTQPALKILLDTRPDSKERAELIKQAALAPKIHKHLWEKWHNDLPSDAQLRHTLLFDWETPFNENAVDYFIREYRDTIAFAKLSESDKITADDGFKPSSGEEQSGSGRDAYRSQVGDYVQWEPKGVLQFSEPKQVTSISADGAFAFVENNGTGLPVAELTQQKKPVTPRVSRLDPLPQTRTMRQDIFSLAEGTVSIQWPTPLSQESIEDLKDWLKIVERKIARSADVAIQTQEASQK